MAKREHFFCQNSKQEGKNAQKSHGCLEDGKWKRTGYSHQWYSSVFKIKPLFLVQQY